MQKTKRKSRISAPKALLGILLAIVILAIAQSLAFSISEIFLNAGLPGAICNILAGILYVVLAFLGVDLFCRKYLKISREKMRIPGFRLKPVWVLSAVLMPVLVLLISLAFGGHWEINRFDTATTLAMITGAVAFYGLATGIVEEMIFRGLVMGCLEERFGKKDRGNRSFGTFWGPSHHWKPPGFCQYHSAFDRGKHCGDFIFIDYLHRQLRLEQRHCPRHLEYGHYWRDSSYWRRCGQ